MNISPFLAINQSCDKALKWSRELLLQAGLRPVQTFDLHAARAGLHDCPCPNHGMVDCDCQMVVLLVYGNAEDVSTPLNTSPVTLMLHGNDGQTWLSIADSPRERSDPGISTAIKHALEDKCPN
jgi:hypothetical protein